MSPGPGVPKIHGTDLAVLEAGEKRDDLPCNVTPDKAFLGFDLRFHSGYDVSVPLRELSGSENLLTMVFRVTPDNQRDNARYFIHRVKVPSIDEDARGDAFFEGGIDLGEGKYRVDWLMRDRAERVCASNWEVDAALPGKDRQIAVNVPPNSVDQMLPDQFHAEPPVQRDATASLHVKLIVNFAPQKPTASTLKASDLAALVSMVRTLARDPRIGKFSLVAFNMTDQKVFHRQTMVDRIDFPAIGKALSNVGVGTVSLQSMMVKNSSTQFLTKLIAEECSVATKADAVIFAGPKALLEQNVPDEELKKMELEYPVYYLNYVLNFYATPWRDAIGNAVKALRGAEFTISRPRDLWFSVSDMVGRIVKFRNGKQLAAVSTQ
jgi:hypothetical protein